MQATRCPYLCTPVTPQCRSVEPMYKWPRWPLDPLTCPLACGWEKTKELRAGEVLCDLQAGVGVTGSFPTNTDLTPGVVSAILRSHLASGLLVVSAGRVFREDLTPAPPLSSPAAGSYPRKTMMKSSTFQPLRRYAS